MLRNVRIAKVGVGEPGADRNQRIRELLIRTFQFSVCNVWKLGKIEFSYLS